MSIWTGIKKALNSTLGTNKFVPLDKQIEECQQKLYHALGNDVLISKTFSHSINVGEQNATVNEFKIGVNCETPLSVGVAVRSSGSTKLHYDYYINGNKEGSGNTSLTETSTSVTKMISIYKEIKKNDIIRLEFYIDTEGVTVTAREFIIYGKLLPINFLQEIE